jgi:hypothetical protein
MAGPVLTAPPGLALPESLSEGIDMLTSAGMLPPPPGLTLPSVVSAPPPGLMQIPEEKHVRRSVFSIAAALDLKDDDLPRQRPVAKPAVVGYAQQQKEIYEKKQLEKKLKRLTTLVTCVEEIGAIQRSVDASAGKISSPAADEAQVWSKKESSKYPGKFYYVNSKTGKTSWTKPDEYTEEVKKVHVPDSKCPIDLSDYYDGSTDDCGSSESDDCCESDDVAQSVTSRASWQQRSVAGSTAFRADAPVFQPAALVVTH